MSRRRSLNAATVLMMLGSAGGLVCACAKGVVVPPDSRQIAEEMERKEQEDERRWRGALKWSGWATNDGIRLRAGLPPKIEIGVAFGIALEVQSVPADASADRRWLFGGRPPSAFIRFFDAHGAKYAEIRELTIDDTISDFPFSVPPPDPRPSFDLTRPNHTFLKSHLVVPAALESAKPGRTDVSILFTRRPEDVTGLSPEQAWTGEVATPAQRLDVLPGSSETRTFLLPSCLRLRERDMGDITGHRGTTIGKSFLVTYSEVDAEKVTLTYPKGAFLGFSHHSRNPEGRFVGAGFQGGPPQPDDINGIDQWNGIVGPLELTYDLSLTYTLPMPRNTVPGPHRPRVLWSRTLTVRYDPGQPPD